MNSPQLVLPFAGAQRHPDRLQQHLGPHRPLEQGGIADGGQLRDRSPVCRRLAVAGGQHDQRQVGPGRLMVEKVRQALELGPTSASSASTSTATPALAVAQSSATVAHSAVAMPAAVSTWRATAPSALLGGSMTTRRSSAARRRCGAHAMSAPCCSSGTPVSTPRNCRSGGPTLIPVGAKSMSRMVRSCAPARRLNTDTARRTSPRCS